MGPFAALERFFERLFERPSARLFHTRLQPIQLQRRVERAMENGRLSATNRVVVPNRFVVRLAPADLHAFGHFADTLELELADAALRFARAHQYSVSDRPTVRLLADDAVDPGDAHVGASFSDGLAPANAAAGAGVAEGAEPAGIRAVGRPRGSDPIHTMTFDIPTVDPPLAVLREVSSDGSQRQLTLDGGPVTIGRATDNNLVLRDARASRYHGRLTSRQGALVYSDLGSTNGSRVNGVQIDEVVLGAGDRIEIGDTTLVVESVAGV